MQISNSLAASLLAKTAYAAKETASATPAAAGTTAARPAADTATISPAAIAALQAELASSTLLGSSGADASSDPFSAIFGGSTGSTDSTSGSLASLLNGDKTSTTDPLASFLSASNGSKSSDSGNQMTALLDGYLQTIKAQSDAAIQGWIDRTTAAQQPAVPPAGPAAT